MASSHVSGARSDRDRSRSPSAGRTALTAIPAIQSYVNDLLERTAALEHGLRMVRSKQEDEDDSFREELQELVDTVGEDTCTNLELSGRRASTESYSA